MTVGPPRAEPGGIHLSRDREVLERALEGSQSKGSLLFVRLLRLQRLQRSDWQYPLFTPDPGIDYLPIFTREGASWARLNKVFGGELQKVIIEINTAVTV